MMKSCLKTLGILIGILCAPLVLLVVYFVLVLNPKIDEEVSRYNGLCINATERYDLYIERLTGLQGKSDAHDVTPLAAIIGPDMKSVAFSVNEEEAATIVTRLRLRERDGTRALREYDSYFLAEKCRWQPDMNVADWKEWNTSVSKEELEQIIGPIENEGRVSCKGYDIRFCFNEKERKGFFIIILLP